MNKRFFPVLNVFLFAGLFVLLSSCSGLLRDTGSATFSISPEVLKTVANLAEYPEEEYIDSEKIEITVSLHGKYEQTITKTYTMQEMEVLYGKDDKDAARQLEITFDEIPVGTLVSAEATLAFSYNHLDKQEKYISYRGVSNSIRIAAGTNPLTVVLKEYHPYRMKLYVQDETVAEKDTDVPGYKYVYIIEGSFDNYENFDKDFYEFILSQMESLQLTDYEYDGNYDTSYDSEGYTVFRIFFDKKAEPPVETVMIDYEIKCFYQKENTTYDATKTIAAQVDIFDNGKTTEIGEVAKDKWESELVNDLIPRASTNSGKNYTYCGYLLEEVEEDDYIIKVYFKSNKTVIVEPTDDTATVYVSCYMGAPTANNSEGQIISEQESDEKVDDPEEKVDDDDDDNYDEYKDSPVVIIVTLSNGDNYEESISEEYIVDDLYSKSGMTFPTITFKEVPVGEIKVSAQTYVYYTTTSDEDEEIYQEIEFKQLLATAEENKTIKAGENTVELPMEISDENDVPFDYELIFYVEDKNSTDKVYPGYSAAKNYKGTSEGYIDFYSSVFVDALTEVVTLSMTDTDSVFYGCDFNSYKVYGKYDDYDEDYFICRIFLDKLSEEPEEPEEPVEPETSTAYFTITLEKPADSAVPKDLVLMDKEEGSIIYTADGYDSYVWFVDGSPVEFEDEQSDDFIPYEYKVDFENLSAGVHLVSVTVKDSNGKYWTSGEYRVEVFK
ncbi:MAG: hypothetical protein J5527_01805 [Treponema sp.]|nr:hypothetical protein [Treponema sp.]